MNEKVCVVGLGYIGLPTACLIADSLFDVCGVDINEQVIKNVKNCNTFSKSNCNGIFV